MRVNVRGTQAVIHAALQFGPIPVIGTSSLAVYGHAVDEPFTANTATQPTNTYGMTKAIGELLMGDARTLRLPTVTVRSGKPNAAAAPFVSGIIRDRREVARPV